MGQGTKRRLPAGGPVQNSTSFALHTGIKAVEPIPSVKKPLLRMIIDIRRKQ